MQTKLHAPVVTFSIQDNAELLPPLKSGFKLTFDWDKYESAQSQYLDYLIDPS